MKMKRLALFASGNGSNALNIIHSFENSAAIEIAFVLSNNAEAKIVEAAKKLGVTVQVLTNSEVDAGQKIVELCQSAQVDYIVLAGFLRKIPSCLIALFPNKIINIHPSLLPKYGGKGMYGAHVHAAVLENREKESGITIHFVNEEFDKGEVIAQFKCVVDAHDTIATLQQKIHNLEHANFPPVIENTIIND